MCQVSNAEARCCSLWSGNCGRQRFAARRVFWNKTQYFFHALQICSSVTRVDPVFSLRRGCKPWWRHFGLLKGCRIYFGGAAVVKKAPFPARRAPLLAGGAPYLLRRATSWTKRMPSLFRRAHSLAGRRLHNTFGAKTDPGLR